MQPTLQVNTVLDNWPSCAKITLWLYVSRAAYIKHTKLCKIRHDSGIFHVFVVLAAIWCNLCLVWSYQYSIIFVYIYLHMTYQSKWKSTIFIFWLIHIWITCTHAQNTYYGFLPAWKIYYWRQLLSFHVCCWVFISMAIPLYHVLHWNQIIAI